MYLIIDIQQHKVVSSRHHEVHPRVVGMHNFVFGSVENGVVYRQHGCYCQHFIGALVPGKKERSFCQYVQSDLIKQKQSFFSLFPFTCKNPSVQRSCT